MSWAVQEISVNELVPAQFDRSTDHTGDESDQKLFVLREPIVELTTDFDACEVIRIGTIQERAGLNVIPSSVSLIKALTAMDATPMIPNLAIIIQLFHGYTRSESRFSSSQ